MQKRKKHGYAECLKYMQMIKEGTSIHAIHMKYGINEDRLHVLWNRYQSDGRSGLFKRKNIRADFALKKEIVLDIEENHLTLHAASLKYGACSQRISVWLQQYRTDGLAALNSTKSRECSAKKSESLSRGKECPTTRDWARAIEELRREGHPLQFMLHWMKMARSVFYYHISHMDDSDGYDRIRTSIKQIYDKNHGRYGYRRICMELRNKDIVINHKTVQKLMNQMGLKANAKKRHYHSYKGEIGKIAPNVLERNFCADRPNQKWTTDVTQVCINDRKLYLSPILDMFDGSIISYAISSSPNLQMVIHMLKKAFKKYPRLDGLTLHSDQGWHYQHGMYQKMLKDHNITQSMSRKGNCLDNAIMENFFGLMKNELLYANKFESIEDFERSLRKYIDWYNNKRLKLRSPSGRSSAGRCFFSLR